MGILLAYLWANFDIKVWKIAPKASFNLRLEPSFLLWKLFP